MQDVLVDEKELRTLVSKKLVDAGLNGSDADIVADVLVHADLRGVRSHGIIRTEHYVQRLKAGSLNKNPTFNFKQLRPGAGLLDADDGMGHSACLEAMDHACELAKASGIAMVGVENGSHCGALSYFIMRALERGMIGMAVTHTDKCVAPYGGSKPFFGTNPIAFGFPTQKHDPVILDMATSNTAFGKILHAKEQNSKIPDDWAIDGEGKPTTDPHKVEALLPFGGPKGYGIALMIDVLTGVLLGAQYGPHITAMYGDYDKPRKLASTMIAIDPTTFRTLEEFSAQMDAMIDDLHAQQPGPGHEKVMVPGEREWNFEREHRANGVPVLPPLYEYLKS
ncbi:ureidoglycolate dehydrogenase [Desulforhopalus sp. 52FAK]